MSDKQRRVVPFRAKVVEPIRLIPKAERELRLQEAGYNMFNIDAADVYVDLLTDSGTGALSTAQMSRMMVGDESYAGSRSFREMERAVRETTGLPHVLPVHQGRAAERVLNSVVVGKHQVVPGNAHFDTTKSHIEFAGGRCADCTCAEGRVAEIEYPFKGNLDVAELERVLEHYGPKGIAYVLITVTCNTGGGQPVSMANIRDVSAMCRKHGAKIFFDAARFAENAWFIKQREPGYASRPVPEIVREMFSYVDGCTMSSKKDALVPIGGFLAVRDPALFEALKTPTILFEGFVTYGGMSGMEMEALAQGLREVVEEDYLRYRIAQVADFGDALHKAGVPIVRPVGGHAVFIDGRRFFPKVPEDQFPAQVLCVEMYREGGVRPVEVGANLAGRDPDTGKNVRPNLDLARLTIPRRVYNDEHLLYVVDVVRTIMEEQHDRTTGLEFEFEPPSGIRHFSARFRFVQGGAS